jgi:hypothetical protein
MNFFSLNSQLSSPDASLCVKTVLRASSVIYVTLRDLAGRIVLWGLAILL